MALSQSNQSITVTTPLGQDVLVFWRLKAVEAISQPFVYELEMLSENSSLKPTDLLGQTVQVAIDFPDKSSKRYFHGYVTEFGWTGPEGETRSLYRATVQPWLWFLTRASDCRIFQQMSVPDIIKQVFSDLGFSAYVKDSLSGSYATLDYCVQYRETAFNFVNRLMEREGIYYYFTHEDGKHTLVLADASSSHQTVSGYDTIPFFPPEQTRRRSRDHFDHWSYGEQADTGKYTLNDFDFENPSGDLISSAVVQRSHSLASLEMYDYPGGYTQSSDGSTYSTVRITERQTQFDFCRGSGNVVGAACGALFTLSQFPDDTQNRQYLTVKAVFEAKIADYNSRGVGQQSEYACQVEVIPSAQQYRPARVTPSSVVRGVQTAIVVGPSGEEIYTDKYGRIKVQFHWDRLGKSDENSSCWMRVAQFWAGKNWGAIHIPRIGQEVIVDFLEGDPDKPIVTGCVYNADQMPPYTLPDNMTQSGVQSRSSKQGTTDNFNEFRFEDKKDSEEIYLHAEKDFNRVVENNDTEKIGYDKHNNGDQTVQIYNNQSITVGGGADQAADGSQTVDIYNKRTTTIQQGNDSLTVKKGDRSVTVSQGNESLTVSQGNQSITISQGNRDATISQGKDSVTVSQGDQIINVTAGNCKITAGQSIVLTVGSSSIKIEPAKITLQSVEIDIQGSMKVAAQGAMIQVNADAMLTLKGGVTQIN